jgi:hypothetical protein
MIFTKALFYPAINIDEDWLKNSVLYWDEIRTIVPSSLCEPYLGDTSRYLTDEGILKVIKVKSDNDFVSCITRDILNYLNTNEGFQLLTQGHGLHAILKKDKFSKEISNFFDAYLQKTINERASEFQHALGSGTWFRSNSNLAVFFMTIVANKIGEEKSISLLTDNPLTSNLIDKIRLDNQIALKSDDRREPYHEITDDREINLAEALITNLTIRSIRISKQTPIKRIVSFKRYYLDELRLFKINTAKLANNLSDLSIESLNHQLMNSYNKDFLPSYHNLKKALDSSGIKWRTENFIKISTLSTCTTSMPVTLGGPALPGALLAGADASLIASLVSYNVDKKEKLRKNPYSYLMKLNNYI